MIEVHNLSLARNSKPVLNDVSFTVQRGESLVIIGPSGSGKSTILRCLNRLEEPPPNSIRFNQQDITAYPVTTLRQKISMIFQKTAIFEGTVADNIAYGPRLRGESLAESRIVELMNLVGLEIDLLHTSAEQLSGGQEQRLAIARTLANEPELLLLDEPTSALDPVITRTVEKSLINLKNKLGMTMIWVSHSVDQARRMADNILLLDHGRVVRVDTVSAMLDNEIGDERALSFARGDESTPQNQNPQRKG